jgi:uncharacterized protein YwgA
MHYSIILPLLVQELGQIEGRKKFQKIVHILQCAGAPFDERFEFAQFGPYSGTLKAEIDNLDVFEILHEEQKGNTYVFSSGKRFPELKEAGLLSESPVWSGFANKLNGKSASELEALSTTLFLLERGYQDEALDAKFQELKAHLLEFFEKAKEQGKAILHNRGDWEPLQVAV